MNFYRYEAVHYASCGYDGDFISTTTADIKLVVHELHLYKETPKGYWIGYGKYHPENSLRSAGWWVSKTAKKRFAYPTKEQALTNFMLRTKLRIKILNSQLTQAEIGLNLAKKLKNEA